MKQRLSRPELVLIAGAVALGCLLRWSQLDQLAVEHFDEGVYSSPLWYFSGSDDVYPSRHLYAPPALPQMIGAAGAFASQDRAPFLPSLLTGTLTIIFVWGFTRAGFGLASGLVAVMLVALSDFHILFSRMALTDVPVLMWIVLAVWIGTAGIDRRCAKTMALAGLVCGVAWWTKYSGWLPLAIVSSGSAFWWLTSGHRECRLVSLIALNAVMAIVACLLWSPWLWSLQDVGGYAAVRANHSGYVTGWDSWQDNLTAQIIWYAITDSWLSTLAVGMGVTFAGCHRWFEARRSTWNLSAPHGTGVAPGLLGRYLAAAVVLCLATLTVGSFGVLAALAAGGVTGLFLWPVMSSAVRSDDRDDPNEDPGTPATTTQDPTDMRAAASMNPRLSASIVLAWLAGLLLMTPTYTPYPRLFLPLLAVVWIAASAGIGWWIEACLGVARRRTHSGIHVKLTSLQMLLGGMVLASVALATWSLRSSDVRRSIIHDSRLSLKEAAQSVAAICREAANVPEGSPSADDPTPQLIVYGFGEPAVLCHLTAEGILATPVQDVMFPAAVAHGEALPTFLVFGPNAVRTPGFLYDWVDGEARFEHLADVEYTPSPVVLFNLYDSNWLLQHSAEEQQQRLEVYRLK